MKSTLISFFRLINIYFIFLKYNLRKLLLSLKNQSHLNEDNSNYQEIGYKLRMALEELGPIFIKFGQVLSTRRDFLPRAVADELANLQDKVKPFDSTLAKKIIETALGSKTSKLFKDFDLQPLAAASIAQVHRAQLHDGSNVIVKVLRPNVEKIINRDLDMLDFLARRVVRHLPEALRLKPQEVVNEFRMILSKELDLTQEAANASLLKRNFQSSDMLYVPMIYWDYCRKNVLVMEYVDGVQISNIKALKDAGTNIELLASNGVKIFFKQVFEHNFFHADMHPGNVFVDISDPSSPKYVAIDFGVMGTLTPKDKHYLAENFLAFFNRDYRRVAELHVDSGWVPKETSVEELESAVRAVCEPMFNKPLKEISFGVVLMRLFETAKRFNMEIQPQLILLQKTLVNIEGLGRELYPDLDIWKTAKPVLETWLKKQSSPLHILKRLIKSWPQIVRDLSLIPDRIHALLADQKIK
jgi:ubiquinone biosynthesis protein